MTAIVIAYEDAYHEQFHLLVKALRRDRGLPGLILEAQPVGGTGNFVHEAPRILRTPLKQTKRPPDRVVCLADADRPPNLVPGQALPPAGASAAAIETWLLSFEATWRAHLIAEAHLTTEQAGRLCVLCLRWSKESLLTACPEALLAHARERRDAVATVLASCPPPPATLADAEFIVRYRKPDHCLDAVLTSWAGRKYKKGRDDEDLLRDQIIPHEARRAEVLRRCPDLARLLDVLVPPAPANG